MKILIIGHSQHGKDEAANVIKESTSLRVGNTSMFLAEKVIYGNLNNYKSVEECFNHRHKERIKWADLNKEYNKHDLTRLVGEYFQDKDIYVGLRHFEQLEACKKRWEDLLVIYICARGRVERESHMSCTIQPSQADIIIQNSGTLEEFHSKLSKLVVLLRGATNYDPFYG